MFFSYNSTLILNFRLFFNKFTALPGSALIFVFYCVVETFVFRVTARFEDPKPVTSQHPCCLFEYFTWYVLLIIDVSNKNKMKFFGKLLAE